jgi:hypothetical protein
MMPSFHSKSDMILAFTISEQPLPASYKTDRHDINEILLKVVLNTLSQTKSNLYILSLKITFKNLLQYYIWVIAFFSPPVKFCSTKLKCFCYFTVLFSSYHPHLSSYAPYFHTWTERLMSPVSRYFLLSFF